MLSSLPTEHELGLIQQYILLPLLIEVVNKNRNQMQYDRNSLKSLFLTATDVLLDRIIADHVRIKKELKAVNIKVIEKDDTRATLNCEYISRGYNEKFSIMKDYAKAQLGVMLGMYIQGIEKELKENS